jgi:hypothetical protein
MPNTMMINDSGYEMLNKLLDEIQDTASAAILNKSPRDCCLKIGTLVFEAKQVLKNETSIAPSGTGPEAA